MNTPTIFPARTEPTQVQIDANMAQVLALQNKAQVLHGKRPFAAILVGPDHEEVLLQHQSVSHVEHAESSLARLAALHYSQEYLWTCTMYSTWEPCAMCSGTAYWANIGRIVFGAAESQLRTLTGSGNADNMTMCLRCTEVMQAGQKDIVVLGPLRVWSDRVLKDADIYWHKFREEASR